MQRRVVATVVGGAFAVAILVLASSSSSLKIWDRPNAGDIVLPSPPVLTPPAGQSAADISYGEPGDSELGKELGNIFNVVLVVIGLALVLMLAIYLWRKFKHLIQSDATPPESFGVLPEVPSAITRDAGAQFAALAGGTPRNAIVACWLRLEDAIFAAGFIRNPAETSAELTERVLLTHAVDRQAITDLAALYREARFSEHELGETARAAAISSLQALHRDLDQRAVPTDQSS